MKNRISLGDVILTLVVLIGLIVLLKPLIVNLIFRFITFF